MSVLIKGMEMPGTCAVCEWSALSYPNVWCMLKKKKTTLEIATTQRAAFCPLVEIKTPHGRIGDLDKLKSKFRHDEGDSDVDSAWISTIRRFITQADTIIEAEGSE